MLQLIQRRLDWWTNSPTYLYEVYLLAIAIAWSLVILFSPVAATGQAIQSFYDLAPLWVWAIVLLLWALFYTLSILLRSARWRVIWLVLITGWWSFVTTMFFVASGMTTGVAIYAITAIGSCIASLYQSGRIAHGI